MHTLFVVIVLRIEIASIVWHQRPRQIVLDMQSSQFSKRTANHGSYSLEFVYSQQV